MPSPHGPTPHRSRPGKNGRFRLRRAGGADLRTLVRHRHAMWIAIGGRTQAEIATHDRAYRSWAGRRLRSGELLGLIVENTEGAVVASGCVWFHFDQPRPGLTKKTVPYILSMYTEPAFRGRGLGTRIVREIIRIVRRRGYPQLVLHASPQGRSMYARLGFGRTWEMRLWLDPGWARRRRR